MAALFCILTTAVTGLSIVQTNITTQVLFTSVLLTITSVVAGIIEALHRVSRCEDDEDRYEGFLHFDAGFPTIGT